MIKFISDNTSPSIETWAKIQLIRLLNENGLEATLYGPSEWPMQFIPYKKLNSFTPTESDIIIVDGIFFKHWSDVLQISINRYSHGRKLLFINKLKYALKVITSKLFWTRNIELYLYRAHKKQSIFSIFNSINLNDQLNLKSFLSYTDQHYNAHLNELIIYEDISTSNSTHLKILESQAQIIILCGAILEPGYFKEHIVPLINSSPKRVLYKGSNSEFYEKIELTSESSKILSTFKKIFLDKD